MGLSQSCTMSFSRLYLQFPRKTAVHQAHRRPARQQLTEGMRCPPHYCPNRNDPVGGAGAVDRQILLRPARVCAPDYRAEGVMVQVFSSGAQSRTPPDSSETSALL